MAGVESEVGGVESSMEERARGDECVGGSGGTSGRTMEETSYAGDEASRSEAL